MKYLSIISVLSFILISCDCHQRVKGVVLDKETGKPVLKAKVYKKEKDWINNVTDSSGHFELSAITGTCPPMTVIIEKKGYKTVETSINSGEQVEIRLEKIEALKVNNEEQVKALKTIYNIFEEYKSNEDGIDSEENKILMTESIKKLKNITSSKNLELLINVWNYYDPTDYSCRNDILNALNQNKEISILAVKNRIKNKMSWESDTGNDFKYLLEQLEKK